MCLGISHVPCHPISRIPMSMCLYLYQKLELMMMMMMNGGAEIYSSGFGGALLSSHSNPNHVALKPNSRRLPADSQIQQTTDPTDPPTVPTSVHGPTAAVGDS